MIKKNQETLEHVHVLPCYHKWSCFLPWCSHKHRLLAANCIVVVTIVANVMKELRDISQPSGI